MQQQYLYRSFVPVYDETAPRTLRNWEWVCASLVSKDRGQCVLNMLDAVFIQNGQIWDWYYTTNGGVIRKKSQRKLTLENVNYQLRKISFSFDSNTNKFASVCVFEEKKKMQLLPALELVRLLDKPPVHELISLCPFVPPKGELDASRYANYEHEYSLSKHGSAQMKLVRLAMGGQKIPCMDTKLLAQMNDSVIHLISSLEKLRNTCKVLRVVSLFVVDEFGRVFLWKTDLCETVPVNPAFTAANSIDHSRVNNVAMVARRASYEGPSAVNERLLARARVEQSRVPDEKVIQAILASPTPQMKKSQSLDELGMAKDQPKPIGGDDQTAAHNEIPSISSLSRQRQRAISAAHLISSQKRGCCGDYCSFELRGSGKRFASLMDLSKAEQIRLKLAPEEASPLPMGGYTDQAKRGKTRLGSQIVAQAYESNNTKDTQREAERLQENSMNISPPERCPDPTKNIPFKLIAQTRAEKKLVDLFMRRYRNGEDCDYLAQEYYGEGEPLGMVFPGYYYQDVLVCDNCFSFYTLIEDVRMKSLEKLGRGRKQSRRNSSTGDDTHRPSVLAMMKQHAEEQAWQRSWIKAQEAAQGYTKQDAAELLSFATPHPAVSMVCGALTLMVLGKEMDHAMARRSLTQDRLVSLLQGFELEALSMETVKRVAEYARNSLFSYAHIAPVSLCAGRLCDWMLMVLQAFAWKNSHMFVSSDQPTRKFLCFLKRELLPASYLNKSIESIDQHTRNAAESTAPSSVQRLDPVSVPGESPKSLAKCRQRNDARRVVQQQQMMRLSAPTALAESIPTAGIDCLYKCKDGITRIPYTIVGQASVDTDKCNLVVFHDFFDTMDSTKVFFRSLVARNIGCRILFFNFPGQAGSSYAASDPKPSSDGSTSPKTPKTPTVPLSERSPPKSPKTPKTPKTPKAPKRLNAPHSPKTPKTPKSERFSTNPSQTLNNLYLADKVQELLMHLQATNAFITVGLPFHVVGFGNGANIATCWSILHGKAPYEGYLKSLVLCNGFARVDTQLAAILHNTLNVFGCFPPSRPDLPVSFFSKFLFSDGYLSKIDRNLALSIYTAVTNAISLDGRIRLCQGALHHVDMSSRVQEIDVPLVLVQSVENSLVSPTNVDPFLQGRASINHVWSHQQTADGEFIAKARKQLRQILQTPKSAFVSWLRAGHELRQESKTYLMELFDSLINSRAPDANDEQDENGGSVTNKRHSWDELDNGQTQMKPPVEVARTTVSLGIIKEEEEHERRLQDPESKISMPHDAALTKGSESTDYVDPASFAEQPPQNTLAYVEKRALEKTFGGSTQEFSHQQQESMSDVAPTCVQLRQLEQPSRIATFEATESSTTSSVDCVTAVEFSEPCFTKTSFSAASVPVPPVFPPIIVAPSADAAANVKVEPPKDFSAQMEAMRQKLLDQEKEMAAQLDRMKLLQKLAVEQQLENLRAEQARRQMEYEQMDRLRLQELEKNLRATEQSYQANTQRDATTRKDQEELMMQGPTSASWDTPLDTSLTINTAALSPKASSATKALTMLPLEEAKDQIRLDPQLPSMFDQMEKEERNARQEAQRIGLLRLSTMEDVQNGIHQRHEEKMHARNAYMMERILQEKAPYAIKIQATIRMFVAMRKYRRELLKYQETKLRNFSGSEIVRIARGRLGRKWFKRCKEDHLLMVRRKAASLLLQRMARGFLCRRRYARKLKNKRAESIQRVYRGHCGRLRSKSIRDTMVLHKLQNDKAIQIQAIWKMHVARDKYLAARLRLLAAIEIQRLFRGHLARIEVARKKKWKQAEPGAERLALGLQMIESSKQAFEKQQSELDALHRAQEAVEKQVSTIHTELQESEKELAVLEQELQEIDQLEKDLHELTHEAEMARCRGMEQLLEESVHPRDDGEGSTALSSPVKKRVDLGDGIPDLPHHGIVYESGMENEFETKEEARKRQADAYAVEMAIQIKKSEREKKKKDLETEFTSVFNEVQQKRQALATMEEKLADMEATRMRKDREFARLQRNLMELLEEQKMELENLREKGIELETATATSAAAAAATAMKAKEHEKRSQAMFESTEELMKFQFMSMSLSYFSSLNMLKSLRDINADTTAAAVTSTAETAAAAAAAAAAANVPTMKRLHVGGNELMTSAAKKKQQELDAKLKQEEEAKRLMQQPFPQDVHEWRVEDVGRWLDTLCLSQYKKAFEEGSVDGSFLLELRPEDMSDVLGVTHKLHVRKIMVARNKLLPLNEQEKMQLAAVQHEDEASENREKASIPDLDTVFSQARNGRLRRLQESIDAGFNINAEDDKGNTLLLIACQNVNMKMVEYLLSKRANINHKNAQGNTPLHFAMAYDSEGALGEYLIGHGADDTIENNYGLSAYDGLQPDSNS